MDGTGCQLSQMLKKSGQGHPAVFREWICGHGPSVGTFGCTAVRQLAALGIRTTANKPQRQLCFASNKTLAMFLKVC